MKKINVTKENEKSRIRCSSVPGEHKFYYRPYGSKAELELFKNDVIEFSGSIYDYFQSTGCMEGPRTFTITVKQLYQTKKQIYKNHKLTKFLDSRLPNEINRVLRENTPAQGKSEVKVIRKQTTKYERVA